MAAQDMLMRSVHASTVLGNSISLKMVEFLNQVKDQPVGFRDLGLDFLGICKILNSLAESLNEHFRTNQPFPERAVPELMKVLTNTANDFTQLQSLLQKFMDFEKGGTMAKLQKTWRLFFADKDIAKVRVSLQENRGALNMTMLLTNINPTQGTGHLGYENSLLAARLEQNYNQPGPYTQPGSYTQSGPSELDASSSYAGSIATPTAPAPLPPSLPPRQPSYSPPVTSMAQLSMADSEGLIPIHTEPSSEAPRKVPAPSLPPVEKSPDPAPEPQLAGKRIPIKVDRSQLLRRTPKGMQGASSAALKRTLYSAVEGKKTNVVEQLLDRGVPPDTGPETNSVLTATYNRDTPTLKLLLEFGADPDAPDNRGNTPLRVSCDSREEQEKLLLEWGADPNISTPDWTALPWACDSKKESILNLLLLYGADPNLCSKNGETGLVYACDRPFGPSMVQAMLDWGADPNQKNKRGHLPLQAACNTNQPEVVKLLLHYKADPNLVPLKSLVSKPNCLQILIDAGADLHAFKGLMELATYENSIEAVKVLLSAGVDPNEKHQDRYSPLTTAIRDNRSDIFELLIRSGADPNAKGEDFPLKMAVTRPHFLPPLVSAGADLRKCEGIMEWAAYHNNLEAVQFLVEAGVNMNDQGRSNNTALSTAIRDNYPDMVHFLLQAGADPNQIGDYYPLEWAAHQPQFIKPVLAAGADMTKCKAIIRNAVWNNKVESVRQFIEAGAPINELHSNGTTALTTAIQYDYWDCFEVLMQARADPNQKGDYLPLDWAVHHARYIQPLLAAGADLRLCKGIVRNAAWNRKPDAIPILLQAGADVNEPHPNNTTALTTCIQYNYADIFDILLASGANPNQKGDYFPLEWAVHHAHFIKPLLAAGAEMSKCKGIVQSAAWNNKIEAVRVLHECNADMNEIHSNGSTPILTALEYSYFDILGELLAFGADPNRDANGVFPIIKAADKENPKGFNMLVDAGANVNQIRKDGSTALMQAAYYGRTEVINKLMAKGAKLDLADQTGNTAMDYAANRGHDEVVMLLLEGMG